jgi:hypothetical protein
MDVGVAAALLSESETQQDIMGKYLRSTFAVDVEERGKSPVDIGVNQVSGSVVRTVVAIIHFNNAGTHAEEPYHIAKFSRQFGKQMEARL